MPTYVDKNLKMYTAFFILTTENRMLQIQLHTVKTPLNCWSNVISCSSVISKICDNTDGCADESIRTIELSLLLVLDHEYNIIIYHTVGESGQVREAVGGLKYAKTIDKCY